MKRYLSLFLLFCLISSCKDDISVTKLASGSIPNQIVDTMDLTNNFYDNVETFSLPLKRPLY